MVGRDRADVARLPCEQPRARAIRVYAKVHSLCCNRADLNHLLHRQGRVVA